MKKQRLNEIRRDLAKARAWDAGNESMKKSGRARWNEDDYNTAVVEFNRLWPEARDGSA